MSAAENKLWAILRSGSVFVGANMVAGLLHYYFQILASQRLSAAEFSGLNAWFANLAIFFLVGGILQYAANFFPAPRHRLRIAIVAINAFCLSVTALWLLGPDGQTLTRALMVLAGASLFGWLMGQVQIRMMFSTLTVANLLVALTKLSLIFSSLSGDSELERFSFALFACYLPALWYASIMVWQRRDEFDKQVRRRFSWEMWSAPIVLSIASSVIPQMDLVLMSRLQSAEVFQEFARVSLFYKGIYFFIFIFAQWLLPFQIRDGESGLFRASFVLVLATLAGSTGLTLAAPWIVSWVLHWEATPSLMMIFAACINMSLLTWVFLLIQENCAQERPRIAGVALSILAGEAALQLLLQLDALPYLALAIAVQSAIVFYLTGSAALKARLAVNISR